MLETKLSDARRQRLLATRKKSEDRRRTDPELKRRRREQYVARKYGADLPAYRAAVASGQCGVCGGSFGARLPDVDHCHVTGAVRGFLCSPCNMGIGQFKDDPSRLEKAAAYLRKFTGTTTGQEETQDGPVVASLASPTKTYSCVRRPHGVN